MFGVWILKYEDYTGSKTLGSKDKSYSAYFKSYILFHFYILRKENLLFSSSLLRKCKSKISISDFFRTSEQKLFVDTVGPSESGGCKKLACKCGWQGGGFLSTQRRCGVEHLGDTEYCPTSKSTDTQTVKEYSPTVETRAPCATERLCFQTQHLAQISQQPVPRVTVGGSEGSRLYSFT